MSRTRHGNRPVWRLGCALGTGVALLATTGRTALGGPGPDAGGSGPAEASSALELLLPEALQPFDLDSEDNPLLFDLPAPFTEPPLPPPVYPLPPADASPEGAGAPGDGLDATDPMVRLALKIAPAVVALRIRDEFGSELSRGVGTFVSPRGTILTEAALIHPDWSQRIDSITAVDGFGTPYRVTGVIARDLGSGVALLSADPNPDKPANPEAGTAGPGQSEAAGVPTLALAQQPGAPGPGASPLPVKVIALNEQRGLVLADAAVETDPTVSGSGWLVVRGSDSPAAVGSPVLDAAGNIVALVSMRVPLDPWIDFAVPSSSLAPFLSGELSDPVAASALRDGRRTDAVSDPEFVEAFRQLYLGHPTRATRSLLKLTRTYPRSAPAWAMLGLSASKLGARDDAVACLRRAVALDPGVGQYWLHLAVAELEMSGQAPDMVEEALGQAVELNPADRVAWLLLAEARARGGRFRDAGAAIEQVIKLDPGSAQAHYLTAYIAAKSGDLAAAQASALRCIKADRRHAEGWYLLGLIQDGQGDRPGAAKAFERTVRSRRDHPNAWLNLAHTYRAMNREAEASRAFSEHLSVTRSPR